MRYFSLADAKAALTRRIIQPPATGRPVARTRAL